MEAIQPLESTPVRVLQHVTPPGLVVRASFETPAPGSAPRRLGAALTLAWDRGSDEAVRMEGAILEVAEELLGPDAPLLVHSGEVWSPLRDGDVERPRDPGCRGRVFAELRGDLEVLIDARGTPIRTLDPFDPTHLDLLRVGSVVRANAFLFAAHGCVQLQLAGAVAVVGGAPGDGSWNPTALLCS